MRGLGFQDRGGALRSALVRNLGNGVGQLFERLARSALTTPSTSGCLERIAIPVAGPTAADRTSAAGRRLDGREEALASAEQPATEVDIPDVLIADLSERGGNICRPPRRFLAFGTHPGALPFIPRAPSRLRYPWRLSGLALPPRRSSRYQGDFMAPDRPASPAGDRGRAIL